MRVEIRRAAAAIFVAGFLAAVATVPVPAAAQCAMMGGGGGGHDHGAAQGSRTTKPSSSDKKTRQAIDRLLSDERGRAMLTEALLADRAFMENLVAQLAAIPEWRAMASRQLASPDPSGATRDEARIAPDSFMVYACPMHPDVTASSPADCPRCGMALVRKESRRE